MAIDWTHVAQYVSRRDPEDTDEHRASVRNCVCAMLCAIASVAVVALLSSAIAGFTASTRPIDTVLAHVERARVVDFALAFNTSRQERDRSRRRVQLLVNASVVRVNGTLRPRWSEDSGRLRFDGVVHVETSALERHDIVLANHRAFRTVRALPSLAVVREACVTTAELPPLHAVDAIPRSAFRAADVSAFGVTCARSRPIELLFMDVPFVFCPNELLASEQQEPWTRTSQDEEALAPSRAFAFHGEYVSLQATVKPARLALEDVTSERTQVETVPSSCMYLEAPLSTGRPRRSFLYQLLPLR